MKMRAFTCQNGPDSFVSFQPDLCKGPVITIPCEDADHAQRVAEAFNND